MAGAGRVGPRWVVAAAVATGLLSGVAAAQAPRPRASRPAPPPPSSSPGPSPTPTPAPAPARPPGENPLAPAPAQVGDLTTRFKFVERYTLDPEQAQRGDLNQYRVALRDVIRLASEKAQGAPDRKETTVQIIYAERPAVVTVSGAVTDTVRRYEALRVNPPPEAPPSSRRPLEGLTVWYKARPGGAPLLTSLTPGRGLTETEYSINARLMYLPDLAAALPALPSRVGDRWRVPRPGAAALLGDRPIQGDPLVATLVDVRKAPTGTDMVAIIGVTGRALMPPNGADTRLNAQIVFTFAPPAAPPAAAEGPDFAAGDRAAAAGASAEAHGAITEVRLALSSTSGSPGSGGRLKQTLTRELTLQRQVSVALPPVEVPSPPPTPTEANSWLTFDDPKGRFHFRHPQELQLDTRVPLDDGVNLVEMGPGGFFEKVFTLQLQDKTGDATALRNSRDPDFHLKTLTEEWAKKRQDVIRGPSGWLPEAEWAPHKMKVYRIEAAFKLGAPAGGGAVPKDAQRVFFDYYLVLTAQNESLVVTSMTPQDPPLPFRKQVEGILKTLQLGPSGKPAGG